jgi:single-stranded DNA-binding protein
LTKGAKVMVVGEIEEPRVFTDREGNQRASLDVTAVTVKFLDSKSDGQRPPESLTELDEVPF